MLEIIDEFCWTKEKQIITRDRHGIASLGNISHFSYPTAFAPVPMHYHSNMLELHFMVKGIRHTQIQKENEILSYTIKGNQAIVVYPFELHSNGFEPQSPCEFYAVQIDTSDMHSMLGLNREMSAELIHQLKKLPSRSLEMGKKQMVAVRRAFDEFAKMDHTSVTRGCLHLAALLLELSELKPIRDSGIQQFEAPILRALGYIGDHIDEPIRLEELADASGYSLSRFKARFKEDIGITPAEYVTMQKIELAKKRLVESGESVTELAYSLGYSSSNYFCTVFKKLMGCSPLNYRLQYRDAEQ